MLSGQGAFPLEDVMLGALNTSDSGSDFIRGVANNLYQSVDPGMYPNMLIRAFTGEDLSGRRTPSGMGLMDILQWKEDPQRGQVVQDILMDIASDMAPGGFGAGLRRLEEIRSRERAGQDSDSWFKRTTTESDAKASMVRLVRTYRVEQADMNAMIRQKVIPISEAIKRSKALINQPVKAQGINNQAQATPDQVKDAELGNEKIMEYRASLVEIARNANKINSGWYNQDNMLLTLIGSGIDSEMAYSVVNEAINQQVDQYRYRPNPQIKPTDVMRPDDLIVPQSANSIP